MSVYDQEECSLDELWYTKAELSKIRRDVGVILIQRAIEKSKAYNPKYEEVDHPELWGLDRHCLERDQSKKTAVKVILLAQNMKESKRDPDFLRSISLQCSKKAREAAAEQGFRDSCHVYYEDSLETLVDECISNCMDFPPLNFSSSSLTSGCKRSASATDLPLTPDGHERRVRSHHVSAA